MKSLPWSIIYPLLSSLTPIFNPLCTWAWPHVCSAQQKHFSPSTTSVSAQHDPPKTNTSIKKPSPELVECGNGRRAAACLCVGNPSQMFGCLLGMLLCGHHCTQPQPRPPPKHPPPHCGRNIFHAPRPLTLPFRRLCSEWLSHVVRWQNEGGGQTLCYQKWYRTWTDTEQYCSADEHTWRWTQHALSVDGLELSYTHQPSKVVHCEVRPQLCRM